MQFTLYKRLVRIDKFVKLFLQLRNIKILCSSCQTFDMIEYHNVNIGHDVLPFVRSESTGGIYLTYISGFRRTIVFYSF